MTEGVNVAWVSVDTISSQQDSDLLQFILVLLLPLKLLWNRRSNFEVIIGFQWTALVLGPIQTAHLDSFISISKKMCISSSISKAIFENMRSIICYKYSVGRFRCHHPNKSSSRTKFHKVPVIPMSVLFLQLLVQHKIGQQ